MYLCTHEVVYYTTKSLILTVVIYYIYYTKRLYVLLCTNSVYVYLFLTDLWPWGVGHDG